MEKMEETALNSSTPTTTASKNHDLEAQTQSPPQSKPKPKHRRRNICLATTAAVIIVVVLVVVILAFTVFKAKDPTTSIDSITLQNLRVALDPARMGVDLNVTLDVDVTVKNPNKVSFKYRNGSAVLNYRGELVGDIPIPAGKMPSDSSKPMNMTVTVMADRLLGNTQLYSDLMAGVMTLNSVIKINGKVSIFNLFKIGVATTTTCDFTVFVSNRTVGDQNCRYKTRL